jgi:hypothetical protein
MGIYSLGRAVVLSGLAIAMGSLPGAAADLSGRFSDEAAKRSGELFDLVAQIGDTNCRQTNTVAGVYQQPDPVSVSQGVLLAGQTVRLEVVGTGTGWSRIREPIVGWVEARYLTPPTPCAYPASTAGVNPTQIPQGNSVQPVIARSPINNPINPAAPSTFPQPNLPSGQQVTVPPLQTAVTQPYPQPQVYPQPNPLAVRPTVPPLPAIVPSQPVPTERAIVTTTCDVLPREGLVVRRQPDLNSPGASLIPAGTHNFQFTGATQTIGRQRLAYIVAPAEGWIQVGTLDGASTLGGGRCG